MYSIRFDTIGGIVTDNHLSSPKTGSRELFEHAPTALWLEDLSSLKCLLDQWRAAGIVDLQAYLKEDPNQCLACIQRVKFKCVNKKTLALYSANDQNEIFSNIYKIFPINDLDPIIDQIVQLWNGCSPVRVQVVNYSLTGRRMDLQLNGVLLPGSEETWEHYLLSTEDITSRECALRHADHSASYAQQLFDYSPISLWVFDYRAIKVWLDQTLPAGRMPYGKELLDAVNSFAARNARLIRVNSHTQRILEYTDFSELTGSLHHVFAGPAREQLMGQLLALWQGLDPDTTELSIRSLSGRELQVQSRLSLLPGFESDWSQVLMSLTDITDLKRAEEHLAFLNRHDSLTQLYSRSYLDAQIECAETNGSVPTSVVVVDINGLKAVNDSLGHADGDSLIQRAGQILFRAVRAPSLAARVGGDEFVVLMPGIDACAAAQLVESIHELAALDNVTTSGPWLSLSIGVATRGPEENLNMTLKRADAEMYRHKRDYYRTLGGNPRWAEGDGDKSVVYPAI